ncbi:MAG: hypothetical protein NVS9B4_19010 [Candidatus Acidiferrum sp.]
MNDPEILLAIDTCDAQGSVSVLSGTVVLHTIPHGDSGDSSVWLFPAIEQALECSSKSLADVDLYAVAGGPGSFTGLRIGLTTVKALAELYQSPIVSVSRLEAMAVSAPLDTSWVVVFSDARRGHLFAGLYRRVDGKLERSGDELVISPEQLVERVMAQAGSAPVGWVSPDPAAVLKLPAWENRKSCGDNMSEVAAPFSPAIGLLGLTLARAGQVTDALSLDASYVRRSDADNLWKDDVKQIGLSGEGNRKKPSTPWVRSFASADAEAVSTILHESQEAAQWRPKGQQEGERTWVSGYGSEVSGFLVSRSSGGEAEILNLAVRPADRRRGCATALLNAALTEHRLQGSTSIILEVRPSNHAALAFYGKFGFVRSGVRPGYYRDPNEPAVLMAKKITG